MAGCGLQSSIWKTEEGEGGGHAKRKWGGKRKGEVDSGVRVATRDRDEKRNDIIWKNERSWEGKILKRGKESGKER
jgi:hypothetical protein